MMRISTSRDIYRWRVSLSKESCRFVGKESSEAMRHTTNERSNFTGRERFMSE